MEMVLFSVITEMAADVETTTVVSGLSCYYSSVAMAQVLDSAITMAADATLAANP